MARYIKISALGPRTYQVDKDLSFKLAVDEMIKHWEKELMQVLPDKPDLVVLPEYCDRPVNYSPVETREYYRARGDRILKFMCKIARDNHCHIVYPAAREMEDGTWRNSILMIDRSGSVIGVYNKNYMVLSETTSGGMLCGKDISIIDCDFGRVACVICFDLEYDELLHRYAERKPDLIVYSSWSNGGLLQNYWAYTCRSHLIGAAYDQPCTILSPLGEVLATSTYYFRHVTAVVNLDCSVIHLSPNLDKIRKIKEKYGSKVKITDPGCHNGVNHGAGLISSETDEFTVIDIMREFELETIDAHYEKAAENRKKHMEM